MNEEEVNLTSVEQLLSKPRFQAYLDYAKMTLPNAETSIINSKAVDLYRWNKHAAGKLLPILSDVEVVVRNAIDQQLIHWLREQQGREPSDWIDVGSNTPIEQIRNLINGNNPDCKDYLAEARSRARRNEKNWRRNSNVRHPRHNDVANRDDVFAELTLGTWCGVLDRISANDSPSLFDSIMNAFPLVEAAWKQEQQRMPHAQLPGNNSNPRDGYREELSSRLKRIKNIRNRAVHNENLLRVDFPGLAYDILFVLNAIGPESVQWAMPDKGRWLRHEADPKIIFHSDRPTTSQKPRITPITSRRIFRDTAVSLAMRELESHNAQILWRKGFFGPGAPAILTVNQQGRRTLYFVLARIAHIPHANIKIHIDTIRKLTSIAQKENAALGISTVVKIISDEDSSQELYDIRLFDGPLIDEDPVFNQQWISLVGNTTRLFSDSSHVQYLRQSVDSQAI
ncbi:Abi family protein [Bifidobacterium oedipodis]|uniref:Ycg4K n=1 Tax=Bifidobacterium oedipodis TaxID=2675322 RepID=A0A7Y0ES40_9BIFI|nr:Abi family protein [Bifidobacterium sp. DSM 109957]NMM94978.1 Ycg4K [Bifidobacterium sp. DSM 109957]